MPIEKMKHGFKKFQQDNFMKNLPFYQKLARKQFPRVMVIACCDSRVDPSIITQAEPGELFMVRNVANLVPPYEDGETHHGTSAALEYAVHALEVEHIVILGHWGCGGIQALLDNDPSVSEPHSFIHRWLDLAKPAKKVTEEQVGNQLPETKRRFCELESIKGSLSNLMTFPWIAERVEAGKLQLHGWYFDLNEGNMYAYEAEGDRFDAI